MNFSCSEEPITQVTPVQSELQQMIESLPLESLSPEEEASLIFMREEEKLARDVYQVLYAKWGSRVFNNIAASEQKHMDAIEVLLKKYSLTDPAESTIAGEFTNEELQKLYDQLIVLGTQSLEKAYKVGAAIEEIDILDLETDFDNEDILMVYENLRNGSYNHLRAYVKNLGRIGVEYTPQYLSEEAYLSVVGS